MQETKALIVCEEDEDMQNAMKKINKRLVPDENNFIWGSILDPDGRGSNRSLKLDASSGINISKPVVIDWLEQYGMKYDTPYMMKKNRRFKYIYSMIRKMVKNLLVVSYLRSF